MRWMRWVVWKNRHLNFTTLNAITAPVVVLAAVSDAPNSLAAAPQGEGDGTMPGERPGNGASGAQLFRSSPPPQIATTNRTALPNDREYEV